MIRRPPRSTRTDTTLSLHDALPISSTDLYLVEYRKDVVLPAQPGEFCQEARWRHFACRAAYRLYECGDYSVGAVPRRLCFDCGLHRRDVAVRHVNHRSEEHTSELQSLMRISYAVFCLKKQQQSTNIHIHD